MSQRRLPDWIEGFLAYTDNTEPRRSYRSWVAVSTIAAVLQRKCVLKWGRLDFYPNLYIVLVGPPAARKGTAMQEGKRMLTKMGIQFSADETSREKFVTSLKECATGEQGPDGKLYYHSSLTIFSTELTVFLGYEDRDMLSTLCKLFDCEERFEADTHKRGKEEIPNVWANLLGATTPAQLQASLPEGAIGSGFASRVIFVYEEDKERAVIKPVITPEQEAIERDLLVDLGDIRNLCGEFTTTQPFEDLYTEWRNDAESDSPFSNTHLEYYAQRRPTHLFKLATIFSASRSDERVVTEEDLGRAIQLLHDTETKMSQVFAGVGSNPLAGPQLRVLRIIRSRESIPLQELSDMMSDDLGYNQMAEVLNSLQQMGKILLDVPNKKVLYVG